MKIKVRDLKIGDIISQRGKVTKVTKVTKSSYNRYNRNVYLEGYRRPLILHYTTIVTINNTYSRGFGE